MMPAYPAAYKAGARGYPQPGAFKPAPKGGSKLKPLSGLPLPKGPAANFNVLMPPILPDIQRGRGSALSRVSRVGHGIGLVGQAWQIVSWGRTQAANAAYWNVEYCAGVSPGDYYEPFYRTSCVVNTARGGLTQGVPNSISTGWTIFDNGRFVTQWLHKAAIRAQLKGGVSYPKPLLYRMYEQPVPVTRPWRNPNDLPIFKPVPMPLPKSWPQARPRPEEEPAVRPKQRPNAPPAVFPLPSIPLPAFIAPRVVPVPGAAPLPVQPPDMVWPVPSNPKPNQKPTPRPRSAAIPKKVPPGGKKTLEKKLNIRTVLKGGQMVLGQATELGDVVEALHEALPKHLKAKAKKHGGKWVPPSFKRKLGAVMNGGGAIDFKKAMEALINNQIEDTAYGALGKGAGKGNKAMNKPTGTSRGVQAGRDPTSEAVPYQGDPLPYLDYDENTGNWNWTWDG